ncbi:MAG: DUF2160 domain-containing protein [Deinococcales bacterium]
MNIDLEWMAWTRPTAIFFSLIALMLVLMTVWGILSPSVNRKGFLPIDTSRGDRLYISLISAAIINLAWLGLSDGGYIWALALSGVVLLLVMRWG